MTETDRFKALLVGPGLGRGIQMANFVRRLVANSSVPTVVDADGLHAFRGVERLERAAVHRQREIVLTPHEGEFNALFSSSGLEVKEGIDRLGLVREAARQSGCIVLLKGSPTVIGDPSGSVRVVTSGSSGLSVAGSGDILAGMIAGLMARGVAGLDAASIGAHLHGRAVGEGTYSRTPLQLLEAAIAWLSSISDSWHEQQSASRVDVARTSTPGWANLLNVHDGRSSQTRQGSTSSGSS